MFHAWFYLLSCVLFQLWSTFHMISWTNLLTRATMPAACFLLFLVPKKLVRKYSRNWTGQKPKFLFSWKNHGARRRVGEGPQGGHTPQAALGHGVGPLGGHRPCLLRLYIPPEAKTLNNQASSHEKFRSAAATEGEIRGTESLCSGTLPGRGSASGAISIDLHRHLHHHCLFP